MYRGVLPLHASIRSVAVLPLVNESSDPQLEYIADGLTDGLINTFGRLGAVQVTARTSVMPFKYTNKSVAQIAHELDADAVLEGSFTLERSASGERLRVSLNLINPRTQKPIWSDTLDRDMGSAPALEADIARAVAEHLGITLSADQRDRFGQLRETVNPQAIKLYMLGREQWNARTLPALRQALVYFQQAIAVDSTYGPAHAGIADTYVLLVGDFSAVPRDDGAAAPIASANKAIALDASPAAPYASLAFTNFFLKCNWSEADGQFSGPSC